MKAIVLFGLILLSGGCGTEVYQGKLYQDGSSNVMIAETANDWTGRGAVRFTHFDGEKFRGEYSTVQEEVFSTSLTTIFGASGRTRMAAVAPSFGVSRSNLFYGISNLVGDQGSSARCVYLGAKHGWLRFNVIGLCKDSKDRTYTSHMSTEQGAQFPDEVAPATATTTTEQKPSERIGRPKSPVPGRDW